MTLAAWLVAWLVVAGLLTFFGKQLGSLPIGVRALVMSGLLVALMVNPVMPAVSAAIARFESRRPRPRLPAGRLRTTPGYKGLPDGAAANIRHSPGVSPSREE
jgi:hypothetical protein